MKANASCDDDQFLLRNGACLFTYGSYSWTPSLMQVCVYATLGFSLWEWDLVHWPSWCVNTNVIVGGHGTLSYRLSLFHSSNAKQRTWHRTWYLMYTSSYFQIKLYHINFVQRTKIWKCRNSKNIFHFWVLRTKTKRWSSFSSNDTFDISSNEES